MKRIVRLAVVVLASWLSGFVALVYVGLLPGFGLFGLLDAVESAFEELNAEWVQPIFSKVSGSRKPIPPEAERLVEYAERAIVEGNFANAARHYSDALAYTADHPELLYSAARAYRFAGQPTHAAAFMLAYIETVKPDRATATHLLDEVDELAVATGATARRLFAIAVDTAKHLPEADRLTAQMDVMGEVARAGDIEALKLFMEISPGGMPEALGAAARYHAVRGNRGLAQEILDVAIATVPGAARASVKMWCRQSVSVQACMSRVVHPGFAGLPPVTTDAHCPPPPPPEDPRPKQENLAGLMTMGLAIAEYQVGFRGRAHRHWTDGRALLKASGLDEMCKQPWVTENNLIVLKQRGDWVFMNDKGPANIPPGEDVVASDIPLGRTNWPQIVARYKGYLSANVLPDEAVTHFVDLLGSRSFADLPAEIDSINDQTELAARALKLAELGRAHYGAYVEIRAATASLRAMSQP